MIATYGRYNDTNKNTSLIRSYTTIKHSNRRRRNTMILIIIILSYRCPTQYIVHCTQHVIYIYIYIYITTRQQEYSSTNELYQYIYINTYIYRSPPLTAKMQLLTIIVFLLLYGKEWYGHDNKFTNRST